MPDQCLGEQFQRFAPLTRAKQHLGRREPALGTAGIRDGGGANESDRFGASPGAACSLCFGEQSAGE